MLTRWGSFIVPMTLIIVLAVIAKLIDWAEASALGMLVMSICIGVGLFSLILWPPAIPRGLRDIRGWQFLVAGAALGILVPLALSILTPSAELRPSAWLNLLFVAIATAHALCALIWVQQRQVYSGR